VIGHEILTKPDIAAAIEKAMAERAERTRLTADWVVDELRKLAGADLAVVAHIIPAAVKLSALVQLGRHLGLFEIKHRHSGNIELEVKISAREALHARITRHIAARGVAGGDRPPDGRGGGGDPT
jgi:phage terminase small subunit